MMKRENWAAALVGAAALAVVAYPVFFRRKVLTWGASAEGSTASCRVTICCRVPA
jgi:hypothetical protein